MMTNLFSSTTAQALAWTLIHSLWQSLFVAALIWVVLRILPSRIANIRYWIATGGMLLILVSSTLTFFYLSRHQNVAYTTATSVASFKTVAYQTGEPIDTTYDSFFHTVRSLINTHTAWIVMLWGVGAFIFSARTIGGWWYLRGLRQHTQTPGEFWVKRVSSLASSMGITRVVRILETNRIHAPIVVGFLKPVILIPMGMISGLTTAQLESILIHELTHIRRADYLINLLQTVLEGIYFFNPFVWVVSELIRTEREHCCDDTVVRLQRNPLAYVRALASLEEFRLSRSSFAVALADNNKQLLKRIRRIMEKSAKQYPSAGRIVPLVLLAIGLFCASWVSIQTGKSSDAQAYPSTTTASVADTTVKKERSGHYTRKRTVNEIDGKVVEEITEAFNGDEDLKPLLQELMVEDLVSPLAGLEMMDMAMSPFRVQGLMSDSLPPRIMDHAEWERFSREFEQTFEDNFSEFYQENQEKIREMMEKIESSFGPDFEYDLALKMQRLAESQSAMALAKVEHLKVNEELLARQQADFDRVQEQMLQLQEFNAATQKRLEEQSKAFSESFKQMEAELREELVKDGYLTSGEKIDRISKDDENLEVNGKKIRPEHMEKYQAIMRKHRPFIRFDQEPRGRME
jgi:beta-lactamase regulating signal transducer with metallopeptidase domain